MRHHVMKFEISDNELENAGCMFAVCVVIICITIAIVLVN